MQNNTACKEFLFEVFLIPLYGGNPATGSFTKSDNPDEILHFIWGAQWLSGKVLDSRLRGPGFKPHRRHCVVSLRKTHKSKISTGSTPGRPIPT